MAFNYLDLNWVTVKVQVYITKNAMHVWITWNSIGRQPRSKFMLLRKPLANVQVCLSNKVTCSARGLYILGLRQGPNWGPSLSYYDYLDLGWATDKVQVLLSNSAHGLYVLRPRQCQSNKIEWKFWFPFKFKLIFFFITLLYSFLAIHIHIDNNLSNKYSIFIDKWIYLSLSDRFD